MEKRSNPRLGIDTSIVCKRYNSLSGAVPIDGNIKNCCPAGFYAELKDYVSAGTILVVQITGNSQGYSADEGVRSMSLAEVRWSKPMSVEGEACYATGLRYLNAY
jgi:hypothetical protein